MNGNTKPIAAGGPRLAWLIESWRFGVGLALLFSSAAHLMNPYHFLVSVYAYQVVSDELAILISGTLPFVQLYVGMSLLLNIHVTGALTLSALMFGVFSTAQIVAVANGQAISCGCWGYWSSQVSTNSILITLILVVATILLLVEDRQLKSEPVRNPLSIDAGNKS